MPHFPVFTGNTKSYNPLRIKYILEKFESPQRKLQNVIHVVGTNGKGSVCAYLKSILKEAGFKVNTYTSPHLYAVNERININGEAISDENFFSLTEKVRILCEQEKLELTIFESLTVVAVLAFALNEADFNIFEAGMGGVNDATNIFEEEQVASVILTSISHDHTRFLGETLEEIAFQKLGVIKAGKPLIAYPFSKDVLNAVSLRLFEIPAVPFFYGKDYNFMKVEFEDCVFGLEFQFQNEDPIILPFPPLLGEHQLFNLAVVLTALKAMKVKLQEEHFIYGIMKTKWAGRLEKVEVSCFNKLLSVQDEIWFDGAHNPGGAASLANWLAQDEAFENVIIISKTRGSDCFNFLKPFKNLISFGVAIEGKGEIFPEYSSVLLENFNKLEIKSFESSGLLEAMKLCKEKSLNSKPLRVIICGSLYLARDISALV